MRSVVFASHSGSPDTPEWHEWRRKGIGGSDAPIIANGIGLVRDQPDWMRSTNWLYLIKTGQEQPPDLSHNPAVQRGKKNEEPARKRFEERTGILLAPCFGEMDEHTFVHASFDGLTFEHDALGEIKVPGHKVHEMAKYGRVVDYYKPQLAHQALVAWGPPEGWNDQVVYFISYVPETGDLQFVEKPAREYQALAEKLLAAEIQFWESVEKAAAPCGPEFLERAKAYLLAAEALDAAKVRVDEVKGDLIRLLGSGKSLEGGGVSVLRSTRAGSVDYTKLVQELMPSKTKEELAELFESYRKPSSETVTVRAKG